MRRSLRHLTAWALITWASTAYAQSAGDSSAGTADPRTAKAQFMNGQKLFRNGQFSEALPVFRDLVETTHSPNARLYVAHCLQQLGNRVDAYKSFAAVVKEIGEHPDAKYAPTREAAVSELAVLNVQLARVVISITDAPSSLTVTLDGASVQGADLGSSIVVEPGAHHVEISSSGAQPIRRDVSIDGGELKTVAVSFGKEDHENAVVSAAVSSSSLAEAPGGSAADGGGTMRTIGLVAGGVGVAGLAVFTITGLMAKSTFDDLKAQCAGGCSDAGHLDQIDHGQKLQTTANVGLVVGLLGLGTGATLFILGQRKSSDGAVSVSLSNAAGMVSYSRSF